ncbi:DUF2510 domain-containing protein [Cellulomonas sp. P24]|uniref:DUF2510 domain-containing protein n=1 Tax=Cellulomonas sp. P24 TaxID=2885206 RepID=UPI00216B50AC|nr:DUF2510 domain-containing protein [Cellulomonas sp. P24]MCR6493007.1 DUF2510 domain-containing protein [Cellulomonas sp. P24]
MDPFPAAGWYDDGATPGVLRWFDGSVWTEYTVPVGRPDQMPAPAPGPAPSPVPAPNPEPTPAPASTFGHVPTVRLGQSLNLADHVVETAEYRRNRLDEALALRRRAVALFGGALAVLLVVGMVGIAMHGADTIWYVGVVASAVLCVRAWRDYTNATYRGAPALTTTAWVMAGVALIVALAVLVAGPIATITTLAHLVDKVRR